MIETFYNNDQFRILIYVIVFIFGLFIGSFLNVVALRLLKEESFVLPPSHCPKCKAPIRFYDNIPVLSWIILGGKCRDCKEKISIQYPIVELSTGILFLLCIIAFGLSFNAFAMMFVISALIVLTVTDLYEQLIFDITSVWLAPFGLLYNLFNLGNVDMKDFKIPLAFPVDVGKLIIGGDLFLPGIFVSGVMAIILAIVFFEGLSWLSEKYFGEGKYGFGMGDTKLCIGLGAWFGWELLLAIIFISFLVQAIIGIPLIIYQWIKAKDWLATWSMIIVLLAAITSVGISYLSSINPIITMVVIIICFVVVLVFMVIILRRIKERQSFTYLPLGPAIAAAAVIVIFYGVPIYDTIKIPLHAIFHIR